MSTGIIAAFVAPIHANGVARDSSSVLVLADTQVHELGSLPFLHRKPSTRDFGPAIRPVQQDIYSPVLLRHVLGELAPAPQLSIFLGDMLDLSCHSELSTVFETLNTLPFWILSPGNHDGFYQGNLTPKMIDGRPSELNDHWRRACRFKDNILHKPELIARYLENLENKSRSEDAGLRSFAEFLRCSRRESSKGCSPLQCAVGQQSQFEKYFIRAGDDTVAAICKVTADYRRSNENDEGELVVSGLGEGVAPFPAPEKSYDVPEFGFWLYEGAAPALLLGVAWRLDHTIPERSFLTHIVRLGPQTSPLVLGVVSDSSNYRLLRHSYTGAGGTLARKGWTTEYGLGLESALLDAVLKKTGESVLVRFAHHPLKRSTRKIRRQTKEAGYQYAVTAHEHKWKERKPRKVRGGYLQEWTVGSTSDWDHAHRRKQGDGGAFQRDNPGEGPRIAWLTVDDQSQVAVSPVDLWARYRDECNDAGMSVATAPVPDYRTCLTITSTRVRTWTVIAKLVAREAEQAKRFFQREDHDGCVDTSSWRSEWIDQVSDLATQDRVVVAESVSALVDFLREPVAKEDRCTPVEMFRICRGLHSGLAEKTAEVYKWGSDAKERGVKVVGDRNAETPEYSCPPGVGKRRR